MSLKNKVIFITGASRGIGLAIALKAARDGAKIAIAAKTESPNDKLPGTIYSAAEEIKAAGGEALPLVVDVRSEEQVQAAIDKTVETFGGIDIVVNNASAIQLTGTEATTMKRFDLMQSVNARGVYLVSKLALPHLRKSAGAGRHPHILNLSPPLNLDPGWFGPHLAYTMSKYGMSLCTLGLANELKADGIAVNSLWPETAINTSAVRNLLGGDESVKRARQPEIVADAAYHVLTSEDKELTGKFLIDTEVLKSKGVEDFTAYAVDPEAKLIKDFFLGEPPKHMPVPVVVHKETAAAPETGEEKAPKPVSYPFKAFSLTRDSRGVARLTLNSPKRANCLTLAFFEELPGAVARLTADGTKVLTITGEGNLFSAGIDLGGLGKLLPENISGVAERQAVTDAILKMQAAFGCLSQAPFPVIAAVNGLCLGAGLDLVSACDFVLASRGSQFAIEEINVGLMADLGSLQRLPGKLPEGVVRMLAFTGQRLSADDAFKLGFVTMLVPDRTVLLNRLDEMAAGIASKSQSAIAASKLALNFRLEHGLEQSLRHAAQIQPAYIEPTVVKAGIARILAALTRKS
ncbi:MAG: SDR family oxidoreductase [Cyanobacteria bacterium HKST-UBA02]|nr:SDR family oxidoreductase [Cyanobacteria bacterium HKST-UBA02]